MTNRKRSRRDVLRGAAAAGAAIGLDLALQRRVFAQARPTLRIGVLNTFSGATASNGNANWNGMNLYFEQNNWELLGRKVELVKEDDQFNPQVGLQKIKKLVESDKVDLVCGVQGSNVAMALFPFIRQTQTFLIISGAGSSAVTWQRIPTMFRTSLSAWQLSSAIADWLFETVGKEVVISATDYAGGHDVMDEFRGIFVKRGGKILKEIYPPLGTTDFSVYLADIKALAPPATYNFYPGTDAVRFVRQYSDLGLKAKTLLTGYQIVDSDTISGQGDAAIDCISGNIYTDLIDTPENLAFVAAFKAKFGTIPNAYACYGYTVSRAIHEMLKLTGGETSDKDKMVAAMSQVKFIDPRGPMSFDPVTHNPIQDVYILKAVQQADRIANVPIKTLRQLRDPGVKPS